MNVHDSSAGPPVSNVSQGANQPVVVNQGVFASASFATLRMKKEVELWEVCHIALTKVPKAYSKVWTAMLMSVLHDLKVQWSLQKR